MSRRRALRLRDSRRLSGFTRQRFATAACSTVQASGAGVSQYQGLAGATFEAKVNSAPIDNQVSFDAGTFSFSDFVTQNNGVRCGAYITRAGLFGVGMDITTIQMAAGSSTRASEVPTAAGTTNQLYLAAFDHDNLRLGCFQLKGNSQGHLFNGIRLIGVSNGELSNLRLIGAGPGNFQAPPGETFAINDFGGTNNVFRNIECDGRTDGATGAGEGATAFGANSFSGGTWTDCYGHHNPWSSAFALWQGSGTQTLTRCRGHSNRTHLNIERMGGEIAGTRPRSTINIHGFEFGDYVQTVHGYGQDIFLGNDQGSTIINLYDPVITPNRSVPSGRNRDKIFIWWPVNEQGNPNLQQKNDVHVYIDGVEQDSAEFIDWSR